MLGGTATRDERAFAELYAASSAKLFGVILRVPRDREQASEVLQEVYLRIWQRAGDFRPDRGTPMTWMIAIARNRALDRRRDRRPELPLDEIAELADAGANLASLPDGGGVSGRALATASASSTTASAGACSWPTSRAIPMPSWRIGSTARSAPPRG